MYEQTTIYGKPPRQEMWEVFAKTSLQGILHSISVKDLATNQGEVVVSRGLTRFAVLLANDMTKAWAELFEQKKEEDK